MANASAHPSRRSPTDIAADVTAELARLLEQGVMPWRAPWDPRLAHAASPGLPLRGTGEPYRGANVILLWAAQMAHGYSKRTWLTYRQALGLGGQVRKGEKACPVIYYGQAKQADSEDDHDGRTRTYRFLKLFHVFNVTQIDDLPADCGVENAPVVQTPSAIERWAEACEARVRIGGDKAFYAPSVDVIHMPPKVAFVSNEHWASTLLHELTHHTGHESRLDRLKGYFSDGKARAREELVAEIGSAILGAMVGLAPDHLEDHAAYIADWLKLLADDPRAFLSAGAKAQAGVDWLMKRGGDPAMLDVTQNPPIGD